MAIIKSTIISLLQLRIKQEEFNSKTYLAMSNWLALKGYSGASKLWKAYSEDERQHKQWAVDYLLDLNILPIEPSEDQPQTEFKGLPNIIALSYKREIDTTDEVEQLANTCLSEDDVMTFNLAQKYVLEQIEEIAKVSTLVDQLDLFGDDKIALRLFDNWIKDNLL
jgi:ferritin